MAEATSGESPENSFDNRQLDSRSREADLGLRAPRVAGRDSVVETRAKEAWLG